MTISGKKCFASCLIFLLAFAGCASHPVEIARRADIPCNVRFARGDFPVFCLSESGRLFMGKYEVANRVDTGRTVLLGLDETGKETSKIAFPDGYFAFAVQVDKSMTVHAVCDRGGEERWRFVTLSPAGSVLHDRYIRELADQSFQLSFQMTDWRRVKLVSGPRNDDLTFVWFDTGSKPEAGTITFSLASGKVRRVEDGLAAITTSRYTVGDEGVFQVEKDRGDSLILDLEGKRWSVDLFRGKPIIQVSDDGKTGRLMYFQDGKPLDLVGSDLLFPVRATASGFYGFDPAAGKVTVYRVASR